MPTEQSPLGLVLSAGGARAAYQVGALKYFGENFPNFDPTIFTGISAGSINAAFLAQGGNFSARSRDLYDLWSNIAFEQVFQTNFSSLARMGLQWLCDLFLSRVTNRLLMKSLLNANPLFDTLLRHIRFSQISKAIRTGKIRGVAVTATNYHDGTTTIFFDSNGDAVPLERERRRAIKTNMRVRHIMASCSIPILFEPVPIGPHLYGDGSLRFSFPFSPAIHLGAKKIMAIGIRCPTVETVLGSQRPDHLSMGFVAGNVLNSIFLDSLEFDYETLCRINGLVGPKSPYYISVFLLRPSRDLGALTTQFISEVPFHLRQLLRATAKPEELGDLLSYLMFSPGYVKALLQLGYDDAKARHSEVAAFLATPDEPTNAVRP